LGLGLARAGLGLHGLAPILSFSGQASLGQSTVGIRNK